MRDYSEVAGQLGVSHLMFLSETDANVNIRIVRHPDGPTMHFRIRHFYLCRQVKAHQRKPFESTAACKELYMLACC